MTQRRKCYSLSIETILFTLHLSILASRQVEKLGLATQRKEKLWGAGGGALGGLGAGMASGQGGRDLPAGMCISDLGKSFVCKLEMLSLKSLGSSSHPRFLGMGDSFRVGGILK